MASAVLFSGGLDSAVLLAEEAARGEVQPIYVSAGLAWEQAERDAIARILASGRGGQRVRPLVSLSVDMRDVYAATHWSIQGRPPAYHTPDEDVLPLPGATSFFSARRASTAPPPASSASCSARSRTIRFPTRRLNSGR